MSTHQDFVGIFTRLKSILSPYAGTMIVQTDDEETYYLDTRHVMKNAQPLFFASVQIKKSYVAFHFMPVYAFPDLIDTIGEVKKRMQGKSCFNFRKLDDDQIAQLTELTRAGYERYRDEEMLV